MGRRYTLGRDLQSAKVVESAAMVEGAKSEPPGFDPRSQVPILELPEGLLSRTPMGRLLGRGEAAYDALWRYVRRVPRKLHRGQGAQVRFGEFDIGLRAPNRVPVWITFRDEVVYIGRKLTIPFLSLRGLMVGHGVMPDRKVPTFVMLLRVDGCPRYLPVHQCITDESATDLADFLSSRLRVPLGIASRPLGFVVPAGGSRLVHAAGETPLYEMRAMLAARSPAGRTRISILAGGKRTVLLEQPDPLGWLERWGIVAADLLNIIAKRVRSQYGRDLDTNH
jgi:hypothetical protein